MEDLKILCLCLCLCLFIPLFIYVSVASLVQIVKQGLDDRPAMYSVELVGAKGIRSSSALDPAAAESPPAFKLLVHVDNGHIYDVVQDGGDLLVSYAGIPLARGRIPAFNVETKKAVAVAVDAGSYGLGIPEDLFRRMSEDRTTSGLVQLEVEFWLLAGFFTCNVDLDTEHHVSRCDRRNFISSS